MINIINVLLFLLFFLSWGMPAYAQQRLKTLTEWKNIYLKEVNMSYVLPEGFHPIRLDELEISGYDIYLVRSLKVVNRWNEDSIANATYLRNKNRKPITSVCVRGSFSRIDANRLHKINASVGIIYEPKNTHSYWKGYQHIKTMILQRKDIGGVRIYFYVKHQKQEIAPILKKTWGMLQFKPDSCFSPSLEKETLVGKFRCLRPKLDKKDSIANVRLRIKTSFISSIMNGRFAEKRQDYKKAKECYLRAHQFMPSKTSPYKYLFLIYLNLHQTDSAAYYWKKMRDNYLSEQPLLHQNLKRGLVKLLEQRGDYDSAIVINKQLLHAQPYRFRIYITIGDEYQHLQQFRKAVENYKEAQNAVHNLLFVEEDPSVNYQLGRCYEKLSNYQQAKAYFTRARDGGYPLPEQVKEQFGL